MVLATNTAGNPFLARTKELKNSDECRQLYDEWAATYDGDLTGPQQHYVAPASVAESVLAANGKIDGLILDAGCGTGLSGVALVQAGAKTIDGIDISSEMLKLAHKTGAYQSLATADLSKPIDKADASYDVVTCVGTLTYGHVGPVPALKEFLRVLKRGGVVVATVLDDVFVSGGYEAEVERLVSDGLAEFVSAENRDYRKAAGVTARVVVLRKR